MAKREPTPYPRKIFTRKRSDFHFFRARAALPFCVLLLSAIGFAADYLWAYFDSTEKFLQSAGVAVALLVAALGAGWLFISERSMKTKLDLVPWAFALLCLIIIAAVLVSIGALPPLVSPFPYTR